MIKKLIEISPAHAMISLAHSYGSQCPMIGSAKRGSKSCPYAVTRVKIRAPKAMNTNQCAAPTLVHCNMRVCPSVSASMCRHR